MDAYKEATRTETATEGSEQQPHGALRTATSAEPALTLLRAAGDLNRLRILRLLDREELTVSELVQATGLSQSSVSRHLAVLRSALVILDRSEGTRHFSRVAPVAPAPAGALLDALRKILRDSSLDHPEDLLRLEQVLERRSEVQRDRFDALAEDWDRLRASLLGGALGVGEVSALLVPEGGCYIDVGTGTGALLPWLSVLAGPSGQVIGIEPSARMREAAEERIRSKALDNTRLLPGDMQALPVVDGWADGMIYSLSLGQAEDSELALCEAHRALKPGGLLVIADIEAHPHDELVESLGEGFRGFDAASLRSLIESTGFERIRSLEPESHTWASVERGLPRLQPILLGAARR